MESQKIELLKKLKQLAERGVGGERENAQKMLAAMMKKHGITDADIERQEMRRYDYRYKGTKRQFALQLFAHVTGRSEYFNFGNGVMFALEMTQSEFIEFDLKMNFYWRAYQRDLKDFYAAFIVRNDLIRHVPNPRKPDEIPVEKLAEFGRVLKMASGLTKHKLQNQITSAAKRIGN